METDFFTPEYLKNGHSEMESFAFSSTQGTQGRDSKKNGEVQNSDEINSDG